MFTAEDSARQDQAIAALDEELKNLIAEDEKIRAALDPEQKFNSQDLDPEVMKMGEEAKQKAKEAGAARAREFQQSFQGEAKHSGSGMGRRNALRI